MRGMYLILLALILIMSLDYINIIKEKNTIVKSNLIFIATGRKSIGLRIFGRISHDNR